MSTRTTALERARYRFAFATRKIAEWQKSTADADRYYQPAERVAYWTESARYWLTVIDTMRSPKHEPLT